MRYSDPDLHNVTISNNISGSPGGGISLLGSDPVLTDVTITGNDANYLGGGLYCYYNSNPVFTNMTVSYNTAGTSGGGIYCDDHSTPNYVSNIQINNNEATSYGGGIYCHNTDYHLIYDVDLLGNEANFGGGIACYSTDPKLSNVIVEDNIATQSGGGIYCTNTCFIDITQTQIYDNSAGYYGGGGCFFGSHPTIDSTKCIGNSSDFDGGGFYFNGANSSLDNVMISDNSSAARGGGMMCYNSSTMALSDVSVFDNQALEGGGIYCDYSTLNFSPTYLCNLYSNRAGSGNELYTSNFSMISVVLDTFTVVQPYDYFAHPIEQYLFSTVNHVESQVAADLYVDPLTGSNSNSGLDAGNALKTITKALTIIEADIDNQRTIHLDGGMYSYGFSGETYPLNCRRYVSLDGTGAATTTLNAQGNSRVLYCDVDTNFTISDLKIQNGQANTGAGVYCKGNSNPTLDNLIISDNIANMDGGGIYLNWGCNPNITNTFIQSNTATYSGAGMYIMAADPMITNTVIYDNDAGATGGGMYIDMNMGAEFKNLTISGNTATTGGSGMCVNMAFFDMTNSIVRDSIYDPMGYGGFGININYSNIAGGYTGIDNIDADPLFVNGPTGDFHLTGISPCVDTGDPAADTTGFNFDIEGNPRILQKQIDMGAYEFGVYWTGAVSTDWSDPDNWSNGQVPGSSSTICITVDCSNFPVISTNTQIQELWLQEGADFDVLPGVTFTVGGSK